MTQGSADAGEAFEKQYSFEPNVYSIVIGVTGGYEGVVAMSMKEETALNIASAMMCNQPLTQLDGMAESAIGEFVNIIVGRAFSLLADSEAVNLTPPTFIRGRNVSLSVAKIRNTYVTLLRTEKGVIEFNISLFSK